MAYIAWMPIQGKTCYVGKSGQSFVFRDAKGQYFVRENAHRFSSFDEARACSMRADARYTDDYPRIEFEADRSVAAQPHRAHSG